MKQWWIIVWSVLSMSVHPNGQTTGVHGSIADSGKPAQALVSLEQLRDASCADVYAEKNESNSDEDKKKEDKKDDRAKKARDCSGPVQKLEITGNYEFSGLTPGWYILRFRWVMSQPPNSKKPIGCAIQGWSVSYVPLKEAGKYKGFAQSPPFELEAEQPKNMDFNYDAEFKIQPDCSHPLIWRKG